MVGQRVRPERQTPPLEAVQIVRPGPSVKRHGPTPSHVSKQMAGNLPGVPALPDVAAEGARAAGLPGGGDSGGRGMVAVPVRPPLFERRVFGFDGCATCEAVRRPHG